MTLLEVHQAKRTMTLDRIHQILQQVKDLATVEWIYFEGGEAFLYYPILLSRCQESGRLGLSSQNGHKWLLGD